MECGFVFCDPHPLATFATITSEPRLIRIGLAGTSGCITKLKRGRGSPWAVPVLCQLPQPFAMELLLTGNFYPVDRYRELGSVNYVEDTVDAVMDVGAGASS